MAEPPLVWALISDLFFAVQVQNAARALGYRLRQIEHAADVEPEFPDVEDPLEAPVQHSEPLAGRGAAFVAQMAESQPALVIVELASRAIPWAAWVAATKASPATRRIPVIAFGPHTDLELRRRALDVGCDAVLAKSRLVTSLPELMSKYGRLFDEAGAASDCEGHLSDLALEGVGLFNAGEYFEAHEVLEHAWNEESGPVRELYRGILQVAVAYLQITRRNYNGAMKMFLRLRQWLDPLPDTCRGVDVARLRADALAARRAVEALGAEGLGEFDPALLKPVVYYD